MSKIACPNCETWEAINFINWKLAQHPLETYHPPIQHIIYEKPFKYGALYRSQCCGSEWYLWNELFLFLINPIRKIILEEWGNKNLKIPDRFESVLDEIGSIDHKYPCKIEFKNKEINDFCLLKLTTFPPGFFEAFYGEKTENIYIDEIENIEPSRYALPQLVRNETMNPVEFRMGSYLPVMIEDGNGQTHKIYPFECFTRSEIVKPISKIYPLPFKNLENVNCHYTHHPVQVKTVIADPISVSEFDFYETR
jgi:hypothetical protein